MLTDVPKGDVHRRWYPALAVAVVLFVASVVPTSPATGSTAAIPLDKLFHAVGYAALAGTLVVALESHSRANGGVGAVIGAVVYGAGIELVQAGIAYRAFSLADVAANGAGAVTAVFVWAVARRFRPRRAPV